MFIAQNGHPIVGVDFSDVALKRHSFDHPNLMYVQADISDALPVKDGAFDNVLAHLSLHYYDDKTTHEVFAEVARVLKPGGVFAFACKSISDPDFGHGEKIEKNLFVSDKGHVRHFFSRGYAHDLTDGLFVVERIEEVQEDYKANKSASFIRCISRRI
jgi:SAM-dependent methyltransferase